MSIIDNDAAFAAIRLDGSVVTWGNSNKGGNSDEIQEALFDVVAITGNYGAFAALRADGRVVTWGSIDYGANSDTVQDQLVNVVSIASTNNTFAAIKQDRSVVTWGNEDSGGNSESVHDDLNNIVSIYVGRDAYAAITSEGGVVTWGIPESGGDSSSVQDELTNAVYATGNKDAFAAIILEKEVIEVTLTSIEVTPASLTIDMNDTGQFRANAHYSDNSTEQLDEDVAWESSDTNVATVNEYGFVYSKSREGDTEIRASFSGVTSNAANLTVKPSTLKSIEITGPTAQLSVGETEQLTATAYYTNNTSEKLSSDSVVWSSAADFVSVNDTGLAKGESVGWANIYATKDGVKSVRFAIEVTEDVKPPPSKVAYILLSPKTQTVKAQKSYYVTATIFLENGHLVYAVGSWSTSNSQIATVQSSEYKGYVTGWHEGSADITCKYGGVTSDKSTVTVTE